MTEYVELDSLWKCETCFHNKNGKCSHEVWCENGEGYRPAYDKLPIVKLDSVEHGHWENNEYGYQCSICKNDSLYNGFNHPVKSRYCPHCGSKMM